ncbi:tRNA-His guanylyltransferase [Rhinocladiella similis]
MANSKYEYVRNFERDEHLLPNTWIVVRIDGRGFHKFSDHYGFKKPNDPRALNVMNLAAQHVVKTLPDIVVAYGVSDEYSFVFHRSTTLFERRNAKLVSTVVSTFTAAYVMLWSSQFEAEKEMMQLQLDMLLPTFDARAVCYPTWENLRDYLSWRQVDCHINNLYNTTFWALVQQGGMSQTAAEEFLKGTVASDKNEILWSKFGVNYNNEPEMFRKGSVVYREYALETQTPVKTSTEQQQEEEEVEEDDLSRAADEKRPISKTQAEKMRKARQKAKIVTTHVDIIKDDFWLMRPWLRSGKPGRPIEPPSTSPSQLN